jgi:hypothetical protein
MQDDYAKVYANRGSIASLRDVIFSIALHEVRLKNSMC